MPRGLRWLRRAALVALVPWALTVAALTGFAALSPPLIAAGPLPADAIVVLGGGPAADRLRMARGAALYRQGAAPALHVTSTPRSADRMARAAPRLDVPDAALGVEGQSQSTLQNALFSQRALAGADHLILVTEAWHLPRAWASFRLAGDQRLSLAATDRFGPGAPRMIGREAVAIWFNAARAIVWTMAGAFDVPRARLDAWLR